MSLILSVLTTLIYKYTTDQALMKQMKEEISALQKEMRELRSNPDQAMSVQKKAMETNMKYMMKSMKPMLITFIPIILIFGWLQSNLAYESIHPGEEFSAIVAFEKDASGIMRLSDTPGITITGNASKDIADGQSIYTMKAEKPGEYLLDFAFNNRTYTKDVIISSGKKYAEPLKAIGDGAVGSIMISNPELKILNLFGWKIGWIGTYIIFSIIFSMILRKLLKVY